MLSLYGSVFKQRFTAHAFRRKLHEKITLFVDDYSTLHKQAASLHHAPVDWQAIETNLVCRKDVSGVGSYMPGEQAARTTKDFSNSFIFIRRVTKCYR